MEKNNQQGGELVKVIEYLETVAYGNPEEKFWTTKDIEDAFNVCRQASGRIEELKRICKKLADIFPENDMSTMDAADFKDRASEIFNTAQNSKAILAAIKKGD